MFKIFIKISRFCRKSIIYI